MNNDEIHGLLQKDDNDDILFDSTEDEDFRGFSSTWSFIKWLHECLVGKSGR